MTKKDLGNTYNEKIEDLNLIALRKYACPKISSQNDWYLKCIECAGLENCKAGKRAVELLDLNTKPEKNQIEKFNERLMKNKRSAKFVEALKTDDPEGWLVEHGYFKLRWRATDAIKSWLKNHQKDGFEMPNAKKTNQYTNMKEQARARIEEILNGCSDEETLARLILADNPDIKSSSTVAKFYEWKRKYPDLYKAHPEMEKLMRIIGGRPSGGKLFRELVAETFNKEAEEVSVEDFLKETTDIPVVEVPAANTVVESTTPVKKAVTAAPKADPKASFANEQDILLKHFSEKRRIIKANIQIAEEDLAKLDNEMRRIELEKAEFVRQLRVLDESAEMFGMTPVHNSGSFATKTEDIMSTGKE